jgi:murein DD-endopeptidase MepM/ murein hydrolase activator NlpD
MRRLALAFVLLLVCAAPAAGDVVQRKQQVDDRITRLHEKIESARATEGVLTDRISQITGRIRRLQGEVGSATTRLETLERALALHRDKLGRLNELFRLETERLGFLRRQYAEALRRLEARIVQIYEADSPDTVAVLLSAESFSDLVDQIDYLNEIGVQDRHIAGEVERAREEVAAARERTRLTRAGVARETRAIAVRTSQAQAVRDRLVASRDALASTRQQQQRTLGSIKESEAEFVGEVEALSQVSSQLGAQIAAAQARAASSAPVVSHVSSSGLIWPVSGPVTSPFGARWGRMHEGIDIGVAYGTPIHAAASGTVIYAGWMSGYGNLVVIDHGGGLATAYGHQSAIAAGMGATVSQGQTIGYVGCTGHCFGPHLHFEVRVNGTPVDPLGYL